MSACFRVLNNSERFLEVGQNGGVGKVVIGIGLIVGLGLERGNGEWKDRGSIGLGLKQVG